MPDSAKKKANMQAVAMMKFFLERQMLARQAVAVVVQDVQKHKQQQRDPRLRKRKKEPLILLLADATLPVPAKGMKRGSDFSMCQGNTR